jgi:antitoxin (DNA-binding transcriptional repressor) of toxin-antitoxin stability system
MLDGRLRIERNDRLYFLDKLSRKNYHIPMKTLPVGELKAQFSKVLELVKKGESFGILYGKKKTPVAMIVPYVDKKSKKDRQIGILEGEAIIEFSDEFAMTEEELLGLV